jgi:alpha-1,2-mannosyltransferase
MLLAALKRNLNLRLPRVTALGYVGVLLMGVLPTVFAAAVGIDGELRFIGYWWTGSNGGDSWTPIQRALAYVQTHDPSGLYQETYYHSADQFIYSPISLLLYRITNFPPLLDWSSTASLNRFCWWLTIASCGLLSVLMIEALRKFARDEQPMRGVGVAYIGLLAGVALLFFYPVMRAYNLGQIQTMLNFLIMVSLLAWIYDRQFISGGVLAIVCIIKPPLAFMALWALLRRKFWFVCGMAIVLATLTIASVAIYGLPVHIEYADLMAFLSRRGESYYGNNAINGLLNRMFFLGNNLEWDGTHTSLPYNRWIHAATVLSSLALMVCALIPVGARSALSSTLDFGVGLVTFTLASPVAYDSHFGFVLPLFWIALIALQKSGEDRIRPYLLLAIAYALCALYWSPTKIFANTYLNFLQSTLLYGCLLLLYGMYVLRSKLRTAT